MATATSNPTPAQVQSGIDFVNANVKNSWRITPDKQNWCDASTVLDTLKPVIITRYPGNTACKLHTDAGATTPDQCVVLKKGDRMPRSCGDCNSDVEDCSGCAWCTTQTEMMDMANVGNVHGSGSVGKCIPSQFGAECTPPPLPARPSPPPARGTRQKRMSKRGGSIIPVVSLIESFTTGCAASHRASTRL